MMKDLILLGSTGSIGKSTLNVVNRNRKDFKIILLSTHTNVKKILKQALDFKVKKIVIFDKKIYHKNIKKFKSKNIQAYDSIENALKNYNNKAFLTISAISGIEGLEPTLNIIKYSQNIAIANKESIICGWNFIKKKLNAHNTKFIPLDSEHFSIWSLIKNENKKNIKDIYLTASGGPFLNKKLNNIKNIHPRFALNHPNWKMGKKITIDSATMMNKIFEVIEAVKIFNININYYKIIIHPASYIHAIVHFKTGLTKIIAHKTTMEIPIINSLYSRNDNFYFSNDDFDFKKLNGLNFIQPDIKKFPLLKILNNNFNNTFFEIILVTINDVLVKKYLRHSISYISIHLILLRMLKNPFFTKYYNLKPKNIIEIKNMVKVVNQYLNEYLEKHEIVNKNN